MYSYIYCNIAIQQYMLHTTATSGATETFAATNCATWALRRRRQSLTMVAVKKCVDLCSWSPFRPSQSAARHVSTCSRLALAARVDQKVIF